MQTKVDGGVLYFVLIISLVISLLSASLLMVYGLYQQLHHEQVAKINAIQNANSVLQMVKFSPELDKYHGSFDLFGRGIDSVEVINKTWGFYRTVGIKSKYKQKNANRIAFVANQIAHSARKTLVLEDNNEPLRICGRVQLNGQLAIPRSGMRRTRIEGRSFDGNASHIGSITQSETENWHPETSAVIADITLSAKHPPPVTTQLTDSHFCSFWNQAPMILDITDVNLQNMHVSGQVMLYSDSPVVIDHSTQLNDVILVAPSIYITNGFTGAGQFFATDTLLIQSNCTLRYPSTAAVFRLQPHHPAQLLIENNVTIMGSVLLTNNSSNQLGTPLVFIGEGSVVHGEVFCQGDLELKGTIMGTAHTKRFKLSTASAIYNNHLMDVRIDAINMSPQFGFLHSNQYITQQCIAKWLN